MADLTPGDKHLIELRKAMLKVPAASAAIPLDEAATVAVAYADKMIADQLPKLYTDKELIGLPDATRRALIYANAALVLDTALEAAGYRPEEGNPRAARQIGAAVFSG